MIVYNRIKNIVIPAFVVYIIWWGVALLLSSPLLPSPYKACMEFLRLFPGGLSSHMAASLYRVCGAIGAAVLAALPCGMFLGRNTKADGLVSPLIYILHPIPKIAFLPLLMLLLGMGDVTKVLIMAVILFFAVVITVRDGVKSLDRQVFYTLSSLGANELQIYRHVIFPAVLPALFTTLRLSIGTAIAVLFFTETFATEQGIGYFIIDAWTRVAYGDMFAGIIGLSLLGYALYILVDILEKIVCRWKSAS